MRHMSDSESVNIANSSAVLNLEVSAFALAKVSVIQARQQL